VHLGAIGGYKGRGSGSTLKAFATQVEALRRFRNGCSQFVRVEQVHVNDGGHAIVGNVSNAQGLTGQGNLAGRQRCTAGRGIPQALELS
jgi:hypothetical protein